MTPEIKKKLKSILTQKKPYTQYKYAHPNQTLIEWRERKVVEREPSSSEISMLLDEDINYFFDKLSCSLDFFGTISEGRQASLISLCFDFGIQGLLELEDFLKAMEYQQFEDACGELKKNKFHENNLEHYDTLKRAILTGDL